MPVTFSRFSFALAVLVLAATTARGQTVQPDTLPRLSPREIEIRGELRVSFPSIARPPLSGFAPAPRLKAIDPDRQPLLPPYRQTDLPPSPLARPTPPALRILVAGPPRRGVLEAGAGSFFSRFGRFYLDTPASEVTSFYASADYEGSYGHRDDATDRRAPYDLARGEVGVRSGSRRLSVEGSVGGFYRSYTLYGARPGFQPALFSSSLDREGYGGHARFGVDVRPRDETSITAALGYSSTFYDSGTFGDLRDERAASEADEARVTFQLGAEQKLEGGLFEAMLDGGTVGLDGSGTPGTEQLYGSAGVAYTFLSPLARFRVGAQLLSTRFKRFDGTFETTLFAPDVRAQLRLAPGVEIYAQNRPYIDANALSALFEASPYLTDRPEVRPTAIPWNAEGGVRAAQGDLQLRAFGGYLRAPRLRYITANVGTSDFEDGSFFDVRYAAGQSIHAGAEARLLLVEGWNAALGGLYRQTELTRTGEPIPYVPAASGWATLGYVTPNQKGRLEVKGTLDGPRYVDARANERLDAYADLDVTGSFDVTPSFTLVARLDNLIPGNRAFWQRYPEAPFTAMAGLSIRW